MPGKGKYAELTKISATRVKKIMQTNEEVGKLAQPVPVMVSRALELFAQSLLLAAGKVAEQAGAKTLTPVHLKTAVEQDERMDFLKSKVEDVSRPGGEALGKYKGVKEAKGSDLKLASLMAHEDADTSRRVKKSLHQGGIDKEGKGRKKRSQPGTVQMSWKEAETDSKISEDSLSEDLKFSPHLGMSDVPSKRLKVSKTESESMHVPNKMNVLVTRAQDLDEDYDNI